jgi:hypothetical protein
MLHVENCHDTYPNESLTKNPFLFSVNMLVRHKRMSLFPDDMPGRLDRPSPPDIDTQWLQ